MSSIHQFNSSSKATFLHAFSLKRKASQPKNAEKKLHDFKQQLSVGCFSLALQF